ncbi:MAG: hypothetical protein CL678_10925 [Bdellovibrionaceae bacterium]|nr:hypothetical protein [Pseudobdellovibrionaceae bacterium]|tara:strand:+ start:587 stop:1447 length:861 start_codon:yes stop_codon:yes gene_type:complete
MTQSSKATLIISIYQMRSNVELTCAALKRQTTRDFEVIFCDDGSTDGSKEYIEEFKKNIDLNVMHIWQPNKGFRKSMLLNECIRRSCGEILIFTDGDCIPHSNFVKDHINESDETHYLAGRRVELSKKISQNLKISDVENGFFDHPTFKLIWDAWTGETERSNRSLRVKNSFFRKLLKMNQIIDLKGHNFSAHRKHFIAIDGFDEAYEGYGREDTDVELRLQNLGLKIKSLKGLALQHHIWHPRREFTPQNEDRLDKLKTTKRIKAKKGLSTLSFDQSHNKSSHFS